MNAPLSCAHCMAPLQPGAGNFYRITIEAAADPTPPDLSSDDSPAAIRRKIEHLLAQMANLSEQEALDQVYRRLEFHLCGPCYHVWIENPTGRLL